MKKIVLGIIGFALVLALLDSVNLNMIWTVIRTFLEIMWLIIKAIFGFGQTIIEYIF